MLASTCSYICVKHLYIFFTICTYIKWLYHKHCSMSFYKRKIKWGKLLIKQEQKPVILRNKTFSFAFHFYLVFGVTFFVLAQNCHFLEYNQSVRKVKAGGGGERDDAVRPLWRTGRPREARVCEVCFVPLGDVLAVGTRVCRVGHSRAPTLRSFSDARLGAAARRAGRRPPHRPLDAPPAGDGRLLQPAPCSSGKGRLLDSHANRQRCFPRTPHRDSAPAPRRKRVGGSGPEEQASSTQVTGRSCPGSRGSLRGVFQRPARPARAQAEALQKLCGVGGGQRAGELILGSCPARSSEGTWAAHPLGLGVPGRAPRAPLLPPS